MDYAAKIRALREDADLTQTNIAKILIVGQKTYSDYEMKKTRLPLESIMLLAKFYNVDLNYICGISKIRNEYPKQ
ncbi:MAG: helix-turn-helix domain-containing protein [Defluviitaleaceae bacterium]|nr:helix-turn-helix domain-containing protein [Defluviitaleaceae bacterium]